MVFEAIATAAAGVFAGAAVYITVVEHPVRSMLAPEAARVQFDRSYHRAAPMQAGLAVAGTAAAIGAGVLGSAWWLAVAAMLGAVIPLTLVVIAPTNRRLMAEDLAAADLPPLLARWGMLHAVRSACGLAAFGFAVALLAAG
jgi:hypothetical protein